jgi:hypothetical protein
MDSKIEYNNSIRTDDELLDRIDNRQKYMPETTEAAIAELAKRGHNFSDEELQVYKDDIQAQRNNAALVSSRIGAFNREYKNVIVDDPDAPLMYTRLAINLFTIFMGAFFGSIMIAINISKTENKNKAIFAVLFGVGFSVLQILIITKIPNPSTSYSIVFGFIAASCLDYFFWRNYIGYSAFYRGRPIWVPLIIAVAIAGFVIWGVIYAGQTYH